MLKMSTSSSTTMTYFVYCSVPRAAMMAICGSPSAIFFMEMKAMKAPQVVCGTCTARTFGKLRRSALRISPSRVMQEIRM